MFFVFCTDSLLKTFLVEGLRLKYSFCNGFDKLALRTFLSESYIWLMLNTWDVKLVSVFLFLPSFKEL